VTRPGYLVEERYRLDKRIAAGGVGQVWRATDLLLGRPVAVKVLRPEYADHPDTLDRFRREARNAGLLTHPHVAQVFDYGPGGAGCPPYLVMEFVDGPSLADILAGGPVAPDVALDLVAQAADGLAAAHGAGLVHRDVKPGNILIGPQGQVKVTDFGIAHAAGQAPVTGPGLVMGTAQYMAPERIAGGAGTPASDVYALGIVLHECLTGVPPFEGTSADVMAAHLYLPPPPLPARVPAEVDALVGRLTNKDPARRISDAGELAAVAAGLRDALAPGRLIPSGRARHSGPGTAVAAPGGPRAGASGPQHGGGLAELAARTAPGYALGLADDDAGGPDPGQDRFAPAAAGPAGLEPVYISDEWAVPARMTRGTGIIGAISWDGQSQRRRRTAGIAVGAAVVTGTALVALLVTGALRDAPTATPTPTASASATTPGARPSPGGARSGASSPAGRTGTSAAAVPGATSPRAGHSSTKASPSTSPSGSPTGSPSTSPSGSPSGSPTPTGTPSPTGTACILPGVCL
jgi:serine/threonine-protein kinase